ncbi:Uma2 family endonuclease [Gloeobacter violaceus]|uniref:Glr1560 protein n=1 Tax=Gloeobacter violaceus (strain ATCC 29082 / PCC 7421) TaxID=251221 RepID=Q7NKB8_GLOVI|nr:Uma2 family endonuclease [Gloeobacter violaceus]BAC89501.1 glr1560 [Gloeobacter violaceus PCC 7421]
MTTDRPPRRSLPTMYDLPSEEVGQPGLPDEYHLRQAQLLTETFRPTTHPAERIFTACDVNLYYDPLHTGYYKRPDWYAVVDVPSLYLGQDMRRSYVLWDEQVRPLVIVELLSPGTEDEDLGLRPRRPGEPPTKWEAYAQYVRVPYYVVFDGATCELRVFRPREGTFVPRRIKDERVWVREVQLSLGIWRGEYFGCRRAWLRWRDGEGNWVLTPAEQERARAEQEKARAEQEKARADLAERRAAAMAERLRALGVDPDDL